jgi:hypothetical protein
VGTEQVEQLLRKTREFSVNLELNTSGQEGEPFEEPFHIRVRTGEGVEAQSSGHFGKLPRELATHLTDVTQFPVVIFEELSIH